MKDAETVAQQAAEFAAQLAVENEELVECLRAFANFACDARPETCGCNNCRAAVLVARHKGAA